MLFTNSVKWIIFFIHRLVNWWKRWKLRQFYLHPHIFIRGFMMLQLSINLQSIYILWSVNSKKYDNHNKALKNLSKLLWVFFNDTISSYHKIQIPKFDPLSTGHFGCFLKWCCSISLFLEYLSGFVLVWSRFLSRTNPDQNSQSKLFEFPLKWAKRWEASLTLNSILSLRP